MIIAVDFDGTCVTHEFPLVGKDIGAQPVLHKLVANGHKLVLWTMRSHGQAEHPSVLSDAVEWFSKNGIPLYGVNANPDQVWSNSAKAFANLYIDDAALGCPLILDEQTSSKPFADWWLIERILIRMGYLEDDGMCQQIG